MVKRSSYEIKETILHCVKEGPTTYAQLERKVNTGFRSVKANCEELMFFGQVDIKLIDKNPSNGRPYHMISITKEGLNSIKRKENNN